jgi:hypothetical protein
VHLAPPPHLGELSAHCSVILLEIIGS